MSLENIQFQPNSFELLPGEKAKLRASARSCPSTPTATWP